MSEIMNDAQRQLAEDNMKLVHLVLHKYYPSVSFDEDMVQIGTLALCNAAMTWEEGKSTFSTYACRCIQNAIRNEFRLRNQRASVITTSLDTPITDDKTIGDTIPSDDEAHVIDYSFLSQLTKDERIVFDLRKKSYTVKEIQEVTGFNHRKVVRLMRTAKVKYRKVN